ncbi:uncharacterized protein LOC135947085 isoform X2 [Cloeon dipterum]|uniref:uncharacterized protein LOC135947085 isoform X2 n=1 Tax=Cloeon dipterum TaxID=197152 RepID=UPI00321FB856
MPRKKRRGGFQKKAKTASTSSAVQTQEVTDEGAASNDVNTESPTIFKKAAHKLRNESDAASVSSQEKASSSSSNLLSSRPILPENVQQFDLGESARCGDLIPGNPKRRQGRPRKIDKYPKRFQRKNQSSSETQSNLSAPDGSAGSSDGAKRKIGKPIPAGLPENVQQLDQGDSARSGDPVPDGPKRRGRPRKNDKYYPNRFQRKTQSLSVAQSNLSAPDGLVDSSDGAQRKRGRPKKLTAQPRELPTTMEELARFANTMLMERLAASLTERLNRQVDSNDPPAEPEVLAQDPTQRRRSMRIANSDGAGTDNVVDCEESAGGQTSPRRKTAAPAALRSTSAPRGKRTRIRERLDGVKLDDDEHPDPAQVLRDPHQRRRSRRISSRFSAAAASSVNVSVVNLKADPDADPILAAGVQVVHAPGGPAADDNNGSEDENAAPDNPLDKNYEPPTRLLRQLKLPRSHLAPRVSQNHKNSNSDPPMPALAPNPRFNSDDNIMDSEDTKAFSIFDAKNPEVVNQFKREEN